MFPANRGRAAGQSPLRFAIRWLVSLAVPLFLCCAVAQAGPASLGEDQLKAGFAYNFLKFVEWPPDRSGAEPIRLCVTAESPLATWLQDLAGRKVQGRPLEVRVMENLAEATGCHAVFVDGTNHKEAPESLFRRLGPQPVLTIGDGQGFARRGGMIELFTEGNKVRFKINLQAAHAARLKISSRLLKLAREVIQ